MVKKTVSILLLWWAILFLGRLGEAELKMDAMTYGTLAKEILRTGEWSTLHYSRIGHPQFYMHPPLVIWMQAIVFKVLRPTDAAARILPAFFALGTLAGVWILGGAGAAFILLFTAPFLKYAGDFFLDGPLAFWLVWGAIFFNRSIEKKTTKDALLFGFCFAAAFLTKGVVALILPLAAVLMIFRRRGVFSQWLVGMVTAVGLLAIWIFLGGGAHYLVEYWRDSVSNRLAPATLGDRLTPFLILLRTYWPWGPFVWLGIFRIFRERAFSLSLTLSLFFSLGILLAFFMTGHALEHYLIPFYPFASVLAAYGASPFFSKYRQKMEKGLLYLGILAIALLFLWPGRIRTERKEPIRLAVNEIVQKCDLNKVKMIGVTESLSERWLAIATVRWKTAAEIEMVPQLANVTSDPEILLTGPGEMPKASWKEISDPNPFFKIFIKNEGLCR